MCIRDSYYDWELKQTVALHPGVKYTYYEFTNLPRKMHVPVSYTHLDVYKRQHQDYEGTINALQSNICAAFLPYNPDGTIVQYVNQLGKNSPIGAGRGGQMTADRSKNTREKRYLTFSNQFDVTLFKKLVLTAVYDYRQRDNLFKYRNNTFEYSRQQGVVETFTSGSVENSYREIHQTYKAVSYTHLPNSTREGTISIRSPAANVRSTRTSRRTPAGTTVSVSKTIITKNAKL